MSENHDALLYILRIAGFLFAVCCVWLIYARQKTKMKRLKAANQHSAIVLLHKRHAGKYRLCQHQCNPAHRWPSCRDLPLCARSPCGRSCPGKTCHRSRSTLVPAHPWTAYERLSGRAKPDLRLCRIRRVLVAGVLHL